jgi:hypothetical protein
MGMTCDGKVGQLNEVLRNLVAEKHGKGLGGEWGNQIINEF